MISSTYMRAAARLLGATVLVTTVLVATGCGSSSAGGPSSSAVPDACQIVTPSDIQTALGSAPSTPAKVDSDGECDYASPTEGSYVNVTIEVDQTPGAFEKTASGSGPTTRITGLGDEAFASISGGTVFVLKGTTSLRIDVFEASPDAGAVQNLAHTAVGRL